MKEVIEEIRNLLTEGEFTSRWTLIQTYHSVGRIIDENKLSTVLSDVAIKVGRSERTLFRCLAFFRAYPNLNMLPEAKNTSWNKIITKYLPAPKEEKEHTHDPITICRICKLKLEGNN